MGFESLYKLFLDECVEDLQKVILTQGVWGLMLEFEQWLYRKKLLDIAIVDEFHQIRLQKEFENGEA